MSFIGTRLTAHVALASLLALSVVTITAESPAGGTPLEGTYWQAIELDGTPTPAQDLRREAHLLFQAGGWLSGSDGCNRIIGSYQLNGDAVSFVHRLSTQTACVDAEESERGFRAALEKAARLTRAGDRLELFDATGKRVAAFTSGSTASHGLHRLEGTSWQLVKFRDGDGSTLTPDDPAKYTFEFGPGGRLAARVDCNQGGGTWRSRGGSQLQLGPLGLTRKECPARALDERIVTQWSDIRSYVIRDGYLYLSLVAGGGIYEFQPVDTAP